MRTSLRTRQFLTVLLIICGCPSMNIVATTDETASADAQRPSVERRNRLADESSPYLLLHAHNPVDWYPWGSEAFEKAEREDKPVFLSIGYSSCHWCHVMERLAFSDEKIASYMNEHFVNIKVDREERPDLDDIYMTSVVVYFQMIRSPQGGGWPLSVFLTPEGKPFAGGTYFPPRDDGPRPGFPSVMRRVTGLWANERDAINQNADVLTRQVRRVMKPRRTLAKVELSDALIDKAIAAVRRGFDDVHGGLDYRASRPNGPKFPVPSRIALLQHLVRSKSTDDLESMLKTTLDHIARGGIRDHLAGGFHRYSTDRQWLVPHFEKMLYDQAQLALVYANAWQRTQEKLYREAAEGVYDYVLSDLTDPSGAFYSALDAETEHIEGKYYVWSPDEVRSVLGARDVGLFSRVYGLDRTSPFEHGHVLHLAQMPAHVAERLKLDEGDVEKRLVAMRRELLAVRSKRTSPLRDDKVLTSWNGLMIGSLAAGGGLLDRVDYVGAAQKAAGFLLNNLRGESGGLMRTWRDGAARLNAYLDDYAFLTSGLLALHETTGDQQWLTAARELTDEQIERFWNAEGHGFFFTSHDHEILIARTCNAYDSVIPSGNSVSVRNLLRLSALTDDPKYRDMAKQTLEAFAPAIEQSPGGLTCMTLGLSEFLHGLQPGQAAFVNEKHELLALADTSGPVALAQSAAAPATTKKKDERKHVSAKVYLSTDKLQAGGKTKVVIWLTIRKGWHINSNPANPDFLVPTEIEFESKLGTKLSKRKYPKPKLFTSEGFDEPIHVYEGRVPILAELHVPRAAAGKVETMDITVRYQCCNDRKCLRPMKISLKGRKAVVGPGEPVRQVNQDRFPKRKTARR